MTGSTGTGGSTGAGGSTGTGGATSLGSPGQVTFVLTTPPATSFCDQHTCGGGNLHLSILTTDGTEIGWQGADYCLPSCDLCNPVACPLLAIFCPAPEGAAYTGETATWNGIDTNNNLTCGDAHMTCSSTKFWQPGGYIARFCATPGTVSQPDGGLPVCSATGAPVCSDTPFSFPSDGTVTLTLPAD
ncbi:MAG TPA: hypothetical protein VMT03_03780 [Polyangia bacterium]|nr:hypothetical protein [Polyangia bacterium]